MPYTEPRVGSAVVRVKELRISSQEQCSGSSGHRADSNYSTHEVESVPDQLLGPVSGQCSVREVRTNLLASRRPKNEARRSDTLCRWKSTSHSDDRAGMQICDQVIGQRAVRINDRGL